MEEVVVVKCTGVGINLRCGAVGGSMAGTMSPKLSARAVTLVVASVLLLCACTQAANVVGIDFGSEWIKAAYIKSGEKTGVAIVLDPASARKFPNTMAFANNERFFGLVASGKGHLHYPHLRQLLGKLHNKDYVAKYGQHYFPYALNAAANGRFEIVNSANSSESFAPEELVASILRHVVRVAEAYLKEDVKDVVITIPSYFTHVERSAIAAAADIAGVNLLSLVTSHAAAALKWGTDHKVEKFNSSKLVLFYDMGATSTVATLVEFSSVKDKTLGRCAPPPATAAASFVHLTTLSL